MAQQEGQSIADGFQHILHAVNQNNTNRSYIYLVEQHLLSGGNAYLDKISFYSTLAGLFWDVGYWKASAEFYEEILACDSQVIIDNHDRYAKILLNLTFNYLQLNNN